MKSWQGYTGHFVDELRGLKLCAFEKALIIALLGMCLISAADSYIGLNVGNSEQLQAAKMQAQQELMALRQNGR